MGDLLMLPFVGLGLLILAFPVVVLVLLVMTLTLRRRVRALQARLEALERRVAASPGPLGAEAPVPPAGEPVPVERPASPPEAPVPGPVVAAAVVEPPIEPGPPPPLPAEGVAPERAAPGTGLGHVEGLLGGTWLNRVGALVLVLGIGFFLKYAFENDWVGPTGRVSIGLLAGVALLGLGERLQRAAYRGPAQGLVAAGVATLYLSVYAAHGFYQLVAASTAFAFMALVTATGVAVAVRHDARAIAVLAALGGFLTPIVLSSDTDQAFVLFAYLAILDAGMLATAVWRRWPEIAALSFLLTHALYWGWFAEWYRPEKLAIALGAATVFFVLFATVGLVGSVRGGPPGGSSPRPVVGRLLVLAAPTAYLLAARQVLSPDYTPWLALLCLTLATAYLLAGQWALRVASEARFLALLHLALALTFLTLTFAVQLSDHALAIAWSVEGVVLLWGGFRLGAPKLRAGALVVLALAWARWLAMLAAGSGHGGRFLLDHPAFPATIVVVVAATLAAALYRMGERTTAGVGRAETMARPLLVLAAVGSAAWFVTAELDQFRALRLPSPYVGVLKTVVWALAAMPMLALARGDRTRVLLAAVTVILAGVGLAAVGGTTEGWGGLLPTLRPAVVNPRFLAGLLIVVLYGLYARVVPEFPHVTAPSRTRLGAVAAGAAAALLLWNLSAEVMLAPMEGVPRGEAAKLRSAALSILWTLYAFATMGVGMWRRRTALRIGAIGLFGLTVSKVFLVDLSGLDAVYRIVSFVILGGVLILASFLYTRYRRRAVSGETS